MKKRRKILSLDSIDMFNFQDFLNRSAKEGWLLSKSSVFHIEFEHQPNNHYTYSVIDNLMHKMFISEKEIEEENKLNDLAFEMDYKFEGNVGNFAVYSSLNDVTMYADEDFDQEKINEISKIDIKRYLPILLIFSLLLLLNVPIKFINLTNNIGLFLPIAIVLYLIFIVFKLINIYRFKKGRIRWDSYKFKSINTSAITALFFLVPLIIVILGIIGFFSQGPIQIGIFRIGLLTLMLAIVYFIIKWIQKQSWEVSRKWIVYTVVMVITFMLFTSLSTSRLSSILGQENREVNSQEIMIESLKNNSQCEDTLTEESILVKRQSIYCGDNWFTVYTNKVNFLSNYISEKFLKESFIDPVLIPYGEQTQVDKKYIYRSEQFGILSDKPIEQEIIDEMLDMVSK